MRILIVAIAFCLGVSAASAMAQGAGATTSESASARIENAERVWAEALVSKDLRQLAGVLDDGFHLTMVGTSNVLDREAYLRQQSDADRAYRAMTPTSISVSVNGNTAIAIVEMTVDWPEAVQPRHRYWRFTDTWVLDDGAWRAVNRASQAVLGV